MPDAPRPPFEDDDATPSRPSPASESSDEFLDPTPMHAVEPSSDSEFDDDGAPEPSEVAEEDVDTGERYDIAFEDVEPPTYHLDAPTEPPPSAFEPAPSTESRADTVLGQGLPASPPPTSPSSEPEKGSPWQRAALAILLIAAAGMIGYVLSTSDERPSGPDALTRSVEAAGNLRLLLRTDVPAEAREFVRDEFGWRVGVPLFDVVTLSGVAIAQAAAAVEVPVFLYADDDDQNVAVFAYSYALLDQVPDRLRLTNDDYAGLAEGAPTVRDTDLGEVLLWRDRDDIYVAVTDLPPDDLINGLTMAP